MKSLQPIAGVDGFRGGWAVVFESTESIRTFIVSSMARLLDALPSDTLVAVDIPIGLTNGGARLCDVAARGLLKAPRASSVFPAPIRPTLKAQTYEEARKIHREKDGKGISKQSFAICSKIREVDETLRSNAHAQSRVREVHPEVSFTYWNDGRAMSLGKKSSGGALERERLIDSVWPGVRSKFLEELPRGQVARDDLNDAFAALWTARRIANGHAVTLPEFPASDDFGLRMEIVA